MGGEPSQRPEELPAALLEHDVLVSCQNLSKSSFLSRQIVKASLPSFPSHPFQPDQWVLIKYLRCKHWKAKRWQGTFENLLISRNAVKLVEHSTWIYVTYF